MSRAARQLRLLALLFGLGLAPVGAKHAEAKERVHVVEKGNTLWGIAKRYKVSVAELKKWNKLADKAALRIGQRLVVLESGEERAPERHRSDKSYVPKKPARATQYQKSAKERGINPCLTHDPGFRNYERWARNIAMGQVLIPKHGALSKTGQFDVMFHFHGHEAVRKEWVQVMKSTVLVGVDLGNGSGPYETAFRGTGAFERLVESVEQAISEKWGRPAQAQRIGLSGWSAGYGAIGQVLATRYGRNRVDSVVLLDGLHSGYQGTSLNTLQLKPFVDFARRAAAGNRLMFVSHSSIIPPGYASTTETANYLIHAVGGKPKETPSRSGDPMGLELISRYSKGAFHVRGYAGNSTLDHCAHIGLFRDVLAVHVKRRWN